MNSEPEAAGPPRFRLRQRAAGPDVHHVMLGGRVVGTIAYENSWANPCWTWSVTAISTVPDAGAVSGFGVEATREAALRSWRRAWEAIEAVPHAWVPDPPEWRPGSWHGSG